MAAIKPEVMKKKTFKVTLKFGLWSEFKAESLEKLHEKIQIGIYKILPVGGGNWEIVTEENVSSIEEIKKD